MLKKLKILSKKIGLKKYNLFKLRARGLKLNVSLLNGVKTLPHFQTRLKLNVSLLNSFLFVLFAICLLSSCDDSGKNKKVGSGEAGQTKTVVYIDTKCAGGSFKVTRTLTSGVGLENLKLGDTVKISATQTSSSCYTGPVSVSCSAKAAGQGLVSYFQCQSGSIIGTTSTPEGKAFISGRVLAEGIYADFQTRHCPISIACDKKDRKQYKPLW